MRGACALSIPVLVIAISLGCVDTLVVHTSSAVGATTSIEADRDVEFVSSGITIHGSYRGPAADGGAVPAAVIIGGTGDVDRDGNSSLLPGVAMDEYRWLADLLSAEGIASIRYDKVGTGATGLGPYTSDPAALLGFGYDDLRIQPARDALAFLSRQPGVDASRLIVIGHSEGGAVRVGARQPSGQRARARRPRAHRAFVLAHPRRGVETAQRSDRRRSAEWHDDGP